MMLDYSKTIETIESLLSEGTASSLTYAALECRLALERACYDRLRNAHDYISIADIKKWQPSEVIKKLQEIVDPEIANSVAFFIGREPIENRIDGPTVEDYQAIEYVEIGRQASFDVKNISKLWHALSKLALHAMLPASRDDHIPNYGDAETVRGKVTEALEEIKKISAGTMLMMLPDQTISFDCKCGKKIIRRKKLLKNGIVVNCDSPSCNESYAFDVAECSFERRTFSIVCCLCDNKYFVPLRYIEDQKFRQNLRVTCRKCENDILIE